MSEHWLETADYVTDGDPRIIGQDDHGDLFVPSRRRPEFWDRRLNLWKPTHWPYYLRSRLTNRVAFLETER
jgi:hypothetical protein